MENYIAKIIIKPPTIHLETKKTKHMKTPSFNPDTKKKIGNTAAVLLGMIYAGALLFGRDRNTFFVIYILSLLAIFFWEKRNSYIPSIMAAAVPIVEYIWLYFTFGTGSHTVMIPAKDDVAAHVENVANALTTTDMRLYSEFFSVGGYPGYGVWLIVLPVGIYMISRIWKK